MDDIDRFLREDIGKKGDITSDALFTKETARAVIIAKEECVVAGLLEAQQVFKRVGASARLLFKDGSVVRKGNSVMEVRGLTRSILKGERLALNIIGRMSGIATETKKIVQRCKKINSKVTIAATRKTTPGFRMFEKKAIIIGGGEPHRYGLYDAVLIKDNHLKMISPIEEAVVKIKRKLPGTPIEIEVENETDALTAARLNVEIIMLDNFKPKTGKNVARRIRRINPGILIEVSGGINSDNIESYASFADRISLGYLTHSVKNKDFSLEIFKN
ncbi:MAG TPA: carboxylating nicotinate-nucleotide diphosphorylase [Candidatus Thermoplasmatota archaeon]|nr:carboxylating nicotinate-nucleotide diphosphorylase [Candidatus Thermoplasmatota archaeon]